MECWVLDSLQRRKYHMNRGLRRPATISASALFLVDILPRLRDLCQNIWMLPFCFPLFASPLFASFLFAFLLPEDTQHEGE